MELHLFESRAAVQWQWPLEVALAPGASYLSEVLLQEKWPKKFVRIESISGATSSIKHYNILFIDRMPHTDDISWMRSCSADVVILLAPIQSIVNPQLHLQLLTGVMKASGVFFIDWPADTLPDPNWFSEVIVNLSHNQGIVEAIDRTSKWGILFYDAKLNEESTLAKVVKRLILALRSKKLSDKTFTFQTGRLLKKQNWSAIEIAELLESNEGYFDYVRESGDASDILEITTEVEKQMPGKEKPGGLGSLISKGFPFDKGIILEDRRRSQPPGNFPEEIIVPNERRRFDGVHYEKADEKDFNFGEPVPPDLPDTPRYLQACVQSQDKKLVEGSLRPSADYQLGVEIGAAKKNVIRTDSPIDTSLLFQQPDQKIATVHLIVKTNVSQEIFLQDIIVPRSGDSNMVFFPFSTGQNEKEFIADIYAYHKNRRIQQVRFIAPVGDGENSVQKMKLLFCTRKSLAELEDRSAFVTSIEVAREEGMIHGIDNNSPVGVYLDKGLQQHLDHMKTRIETALKNDTSIDTDLYSKANEQLLVFLAVKGSLIYTNHLRGRVTPKGPLQIITNLQDYIPIDFVYSYPSPPATATLCRKSKDALQNGKCCGDVDENAASSDIVCPFGFWSCNRVIERHSYQKRQNTGDAHYCIVSEPTRERETLEILNNTLFGSSDRVDRAGTGLIREIRENIQKYTASFAEATDWDHWSVLVGANHPDSYIMVVHIEKNNIFLVDQIELGTKKFLLQTEIGSKVILKNHLTPPPFVVVLGCQATDLDNEGFDVSSHFLNVGAAIVLSNFTRIQGNHARDIIVSLVKFLEEHGKEGRSFGETMLKLRRHLLSQGLVAGLTLVSQGDADWKIKT